ncbi:hypothetical protein KSP40_PGU016220 [Platanthera guangdongensis]|uniref:Glucose-6-phosphate dehydrogenase C-terminal domain-containing protein n=1 Tax=Platanthera guangdongensis TaxID=2320717 RepID=A0ABR2LFN7_9ASPA
MVSNRRGLSSQQASSSKEKASRYPPSERKGSKTIGLSGIDAVRDCSNNQFVKIRDACERLLLDAIEGERRFFIRSDELDAAWALFTPLLKELEENKIAPELYPFGSHEPVSAHYLAAKYNVRWGDLSAEH